MEQQKSSVVTCPMCNAKTKVLWAEPDSITSCPMCQTCFAAFKETKPKAALRYKIYFVPKIIHHPPSRWSILPSRQYSFEDLAGYIDTCFKTNAKKTERNSLIITDRSALSALVNHLFDLLTEIKPLSLPGFRFRVENDLPLKDRRRAMDHIGQLYQRYIQEFKAKQAQNQRVAFDLAEQLRRSRAPAAPSVSLPAVTQLPWKILPAGEHPFPAILSHFEQLQRTSRHVQYDLERLHRMQSLNPSATYVGINEFAGYIVFYFAERRVAVLECPIVGNAIYAIHGDWKHLSRLSKAALLNYYSDKVTRIVHNGNWFLQLKQAIQHP
jgi:hypothetical protein